MTLEDRIRRAEAQHFAALDISVRESSLPLRSGVRLRVLEHGSGPPVLLLHGVTMSAAAWASLMAALPDRRLLALDLPGHGLSGGVAYRRGAVRAQLAGMLVDALDQLELGRVPVVGHSLGAMIALWHLADGGGRVASLIAFGDPAVALPGARARMPLSLLGTPGAGLALLRSPSPRWAYRALLVRGLGAAETRVAGTPLIDALRLAARRPDNARTVASLMRTLTRGSHPPPENVLTHQELAAITAPVTLLRGTEDPPLSPRDSRPSS